MNRFRNLKPILVAALAVLALGALTGMALAKDGGQRSEKRHHGHHRHHHGTAGTIASFDAKTGRLTISLLDGETVGGFVTERTRIKCEDEHSPDITHLRRGEEEPGDDNGGSGRGPSGHDDNGTGANCTPSDLIPGAVVEEAELEIEHGSATFREIELND
jgi:hypothetical protein